MEGEYKIELKGAHRPKRTYLVQILKIKCNVKQKVFSQAHTCKFLSITTYIYPIPSSFIKKSKEKCLKELLTIKKFKAN